MTEFRVVGIMSGTSLDGVDLALCTFIESDGDWKFSVEAAETVGYNEEWASTLATIHSKNAEELALTNIKYGEFLGDLVRKFLDGNKPSANFISSHGHTVFHQPQKRFTFQLGHGAAIRVAAALPVICDFRTTDMALGGQGAPLVPIGDKLLFSNYTYCLNLGGIANISYDAAGDRVAFDVCPCNIILNSLAGEVDKSFDENGTLASSGKINSDLLNQLNSLDYYSNPFPKTLGREDIERDFLPIFNKIQLSINDKLSTFCEHVAQQIGAVVSDNQNSTLLITGGGTYNNYLIDRIQFYSKAKVVIPDKTIIEFKEAIIFAFLGVLRWIGMVNCLKSVTGAQRDSIGGAIYLS